jgi:peptidoglycan hydrolase-like protein with peptidoglycan-binding domain
MHERPRLDADGRRQVSTATVLRSLPGHFRWDALKTRPAAAGIMALQHAAGNHAVSGAVNLSRSTADAAGPADAKEQDQLRAGASGEKEYSARFEGDKRIADVALGATTLALGARGLAVTKLQWALVDLGYLPAAGNSGTFNAKTKAALLKFQKDKGVPQTGELDSATLMMLNTVYDTRKPYVDMAKHDPMSPGTHVLTAADRAAAVSAMVPAPVLGAPRAFQEDLGPPKGKYGPRIHAHLYKIINAFHKQLFEDKKPLRADPAKNFHSWSTLEAPAKAAQSVVDKVFGSQYGVKAALTHGGGNFIDQWEDEVATDAGMTAAEMKDKAAEKIRYLINSNCDKINAEHSAVPSRAAEKAILDPIVANFVSDAAKVQQLLDLDIGWEGAALNGVVYLQRFKSTNPEAGKAKEANRVQMWKLFNTCIHEYLHTLAHPQFNAFAQTFRDAGDETRYNTLAEGFCDFFTLTVRSTVTPSTVQAEVEGPYANGNAPPLVHPGVYPSQARAEQVVSIVGIKNAQRAYFGGRTELIGKP